MKVIIHKCDVCETSINVLTDIPFPLRKEVYEDEPGREMGWTGNIDICEICIKKIFLKYLRQIEPQLYKSGYCPIRKVQEILK